MPALNAANGAFAAWLPVELGAYQIIAPVRQDKTGFLYRGEELQTSRKVAIRFGLEENTWDDPLQERRRLALRLLEHSNIARFLAEGGQPGRHYVVVEWVEGQNVEKLVAECRSQSFVLPFEYVYGCFRQLCSALHALHDRGIVHRDVRPSNIIVGPAGPVKLIPCILMPREGSVSDAMQTSGGTSTSDYLAPEQRADSKCVDVDHRSDIYSLGVVTYEMLTGLLPQENVRKPSAVNKTVPSWFDALLLSMIKHDPKGRPSNETVLRTTGSVPRSEPGWNTRKQWRYKRNCTF